MGEPEPGPSPGGAVGYGVLTLAGAPIGNPQDASPRLAAAIAAADIVAAEDTRRLHRLTGALGVHPARVVSYFEGNEAARTAELVEQLQAGRSVLLITDAGMPSVSDPGYRLVVAAVAVGIGVTSLPGPSAVTAALAVSGLPCDRFCFEGFLPRKAAARRTALGALAGESRTMVFFEAPHRLAAMLADVRDALGADRAAAVCRELTKTHEEVRRGPLAELAGWAVEGARGEITVVVAGRVGLPADLDPADLAVSVAAKVGIGMTRRDAITAVAAETGVSRRTVYAAAHPTGDPAAPNR